MERKPVTAAAEEFPAFVRPLLMGARVYDSSCSSAAKVWFLDRDGGYYLKRAPAGTLKKEETLTRFFHQKGMAAEVLGYESGEWDWLLTARVPGEDCIFPAYLADPQRLCDTTAQLLRMLHSTDPRGCPIPNRTADYRNMAAENHRRGVYDLHLFSDRWARWRFASVEEAWNEVERNGRYLKTETLLHGDYCLPNIMLDNWKFAGFLDLDAGGVGDRHVDLFWGTWTLQYNLKTDAYRERFLDAYGRDMVNEDVFRTVAAIEIFG